MMEKFLLLLLPLLWAATEGLPQGVAGPSLERFLATEAAVDHWGEDDLVAVATDGVDRVAGYGQEEEDQEEEDADRAYVEAMKQYYRELQAYYEEHGFYPEDFQGEQERGEPQAILPPSPPAPPPPPPPPPSPPSQQEHHSYHRQYEAAKKRRRQQVGAGGILHEQAALGVSRQEGLMASVMPESPLAQFLVSFTALGLLTQAFLFPHGKRTVANPGTSTRRKRRDMMRW